MPASSREPIRLSAAESDVDGVLVGVLGLVALWTAVSVLMRDDFGLLGGIIIYSHEAGHPIFGMLGPFMLMAGGTIMQILVPLAFIVTFYVRGQRWSAAVTAFWLAASLRYCADYSKDAIDQQLPLIHTGMSASEEIEQFGGTGHDWVGMIEYFNLPLSIANGISGVFFLLAVAAWAGGLGLGLWESGVRLPASAPAKSKRRPAPKRQPRGS